MFCLKRDDKVNFKLINGLIFVDACINDKHSAKFMLDTGCNSILRVTEEFAEKLNLPEKNKEIIFFKKYSF